MTRWFHTHVRRGSRWAAGTASESSQAAGVAWKCDGCCQRPCWLQSGRFGGLGKSGAGQDRSLESRGLNCTGTAEVFTQDGWKLCKMNQKKVILNTFWEKGDRLTPVTAVCLNPSWHKRKEEGDSFSHLFISRETLFSSLFLPKASHLFIYWSQRLLITDAK